MLVIGSLAVLVLLAMVVDVIVMVEEAVPVRLVVVN